VAGDARVLDVRALSAFAESSADENERDYEAITEAVGVGRIAAATGL